MTTTEPLARYQNGNSTVAIYGDGTKVRECEGQPAPEHPESIDLKITGWCDGACAYCHESSTPQGQHAEVSTILEIVGGLPPGVEIAIGGGDPFSHPEIGPILERLANSGLIANVTVNGRHLQRHAGAIRRFRAAGLLYGLGVSYALGMMAAFEKTADDNTVVHFIAGEHRPADAIALLRVHPKILVLGYKRFGRGINYFGARVDHCIGAWRYWIGPMMRMGATVCFDNLALEQLSIQQQIPAGLWERSYMGTDGQFTMYVDAVRDEYAPSSTSLRRPRNGMSIRQMFATLRPTAHLGAEANAG